MLSHRCSRYPATALHLAPLLLGLLAGLGGFAAPALAAPARLASVTAADAGCLQVHVEEGRVTFVDDASGSTAYGTVDNDPALNAVVTYGTLAVAQAVTLVNWTISGPAAYAGGLHPTAVYRKTKMNGMAQFAWSGSDYNYGYTLEHWLYLVLPQPLVQGQTYTLQIAAGVNTDNTSANLTFDIFQNRSEAVKVNLVGYETQNSIKAADLYLWMGNGGARDYHGSVGQKVYLYNVATTAVVDVGTVAFWKADGNDVFGRNMLRSAVWTADFTGFNIPGTYRLAIEGVGCSQDFRIASGIYHDPLLVSTRGFFYMRLGDPGTGITPVTRRPRYLPGVDPAGFKVIMTTMHPYRAEWAGGGDRWDQPAFFSSYVQPGSPENPSAKGGHADALDWDRHLGHVIIIHDLLLPYLLSAGRLADDDFGIPESGNGIPDLIDEARYEVDFWLSLRDGAGYAHGVCNPQGNVMYQAGANPMAAWAAAAAAAMLAEAFRVSGHASEMATYRDAAIAAYNYANGLADPMLDQTLEAGMAVFRGRDLKMTAAAFLYNLTGDTAWEDVINTESAATSNTSLIENMTTPKLNQHYASVAYLTCPQTIHYQALRERMRASLVYWAQNRANQRLNRPSRRGTNNDYGYFHTIQNMHDAIIAHAVTTDAAVRANLLDALTLEADWGLGRNPLNMIQMTTASTPLAAQRSVLAAYTSGRNDGTPGLHPGHTPYMNMDDWAPGMVMGRPSALSGQGYPAAANWPNGELFFNTRYVWAHGEFTPQQTMRGKQALYGYLYAIRSVTPLPGDLNGDGVVNALDLQIVIASFGRTVGSPGCDPRADANGDGVVNALDLQIVIANFGQGGP